MSTDCESPFRYFVFNLSVSSNVAIPGLIPESSTSETDVSVHIGDSPCAMGLISPNCCQEIWDVSPYRDDAGVPIRRVLRLDHGMFFRIEYCDGVRFWLDRHGTEVWTCWPEQSSLEDMATYLLGPIFGMLLRLRGLTCLHASAVAIDNNAAVAFVGPGGAGKSTLAAMFARCGNSVLSDDVVALRWENQTCYVLPAYPHLSVWPEAGALIYGSSTTLPRFTPTWEKRRLALTGPLQFELRPLPLRKVYLLGDRTSDTTPIIQELSGHKGFMRILANTYGSYILDMPERTAEMLELGKILKGVKISTLRVQDGLTNPDEIATKVQSDARN